MRKTAKNMRPHNADEIAAMADRGEDIPCFSSNNGRRMPPIQRVNVDFAQPMLEELDDAVRALNISRQAVIKSLLRQALHQQFLARRSRIAS